MEPLFPPPCVSGSGRRHQDGQWPTLSAAVKFGSTNLSITDRVGGGARGPGPVRCAVWWVRPQPRELPSSSDSTREREPDGELTYLPFHLTANEEWRARPAAYQNTTLLGSRSLLHCCIAASSLNKHAPGDFQWQQAQAKAPLPTPAHTHIHT